MTHTFSQNGEDKIILDFFKKKYGKDFKGTVLDIGANDGVTLSNSHLFIRNGLRGVLVEPDPIAFHKLGLNYNESEYYSQIITVPKAINTIDQERIMYCSDSHLSKKDTGLLSTLVKDETKRWRGSQKFTEKKVSCITFDSLVRSLSFEKAFDSITIDAEGLDYEILSQIDLDKYDVKVVCVEFNGKNRELYTHYCISFGMKVIHENGENLIFAK